MTPLRSAADGDAHEPIHILSLSTLFPDATRPNFGIFVAKSLSALARQPGIELTIVAPLGMPLWPLSHHSRYAALRTLPHDELWQGIRVLRPRFPLLPRIGARLNAAAIARAVLPIAKAMQQSGKLDVLDAQFFHPEGPAAARIAKATGLPFSIKARGSDISLWATRGDTGPAILAAAQAADGLLAVADTLKADMVALGMAGDKIRTHYTGLDASVFCPLDRGSARGEWGLPSGVPVLLTVGTLTARKGQAAMIEAMALLPDDVHYVLAGSGDDEGRLRSMIGERGLAERVRLLGSVPHDRLPSLYAAADAMVLPSLSEGLANAWVEALGCGVPLVLFDIPPAHEIIDAPDAGRIADATPQALAAAVVDVLAMPRDREALAARTHRRFDWNRNGAELAAHLRSLVRSGASAA